MKKSLLLVSLVFMFSGCVMENTTINIEKPKIQHTEIIKDEIPTLKRKVAIVRFNNESKYGKSTLFGLDYNIGKQTTDILSAKLAESNKFILLERSDKDKIEAELKQHNLKSLNIMADYLIVGSVSEFGRKYLSNVGMFSRSKIQMAYAKVNIRIIDVRTGQIIFAQEGSGTAKSEIGTSFGVGTQVGYDSTLNDKAISAAISSVVDGIKQNLLNKPWRSFILSVSGKNIIMAGGYKQGVRIGDVFSIYIKGKKIKNPQTGISIELPGKKIAKIKVISQFGSDYTNEGSVCQIINGTIKGERINDLYIEK